MAGGMGVGAGFAGAGDDDGDGEASSARSGGVPVSKIKASNVTERMEALEEGRMNNDK